MSKNRIVPAFIKTIRHVEIVRDQGYECSYCKRPAAHFLTFASKFPQRAPAPVYVCESELCLIALCNPPGELQ